MEDVEKKSMRTRNIKKAILAVIFCLIIVGLIAVIAPIFERKYARNKTVDFFAQKEDFDVLFFGSSHMMNSIYPMELWNKYGIVSYNLGSHSEMLPLTYWNFRLAMEYHKPKLVVVDTYRIVKTMDGMNTTEKDIGAIHDSLDAYPVSKLKIDAISDLFREKKSLKVQLSFLFDFTTYHARWEELTEEDFGEPNQTEKGANARFNVTSSTRKIDYDKVPEANITGYESVNYLRKIINYCKDNGIEILLTLLPFGVTTEEQAGYAKYFTKLANDYNIKYLNFLEFNPIENQQIDYFDSGHLNASGARKITEYVGKYIQEKYNISNHKMDDEYAFWNNDYDEYVDFKIESLKEYRTKRDIYLMLLAREDDIYYEITLVDDFKPSNSPIVDLLLKNLNREYKTTKVLDGHKDSNMMIVTYDKRNNEKIDEVYF